MSENSPFAWHRPLFERRSAIFAIAVTITIAIGGLVEIVPMYSASLGPQPMPGVTPYTPLELAGRDIYVSEGCYNCHSQWVRPFRAETLRYLEWSRAGEYAYDRPFQLGSRRIGPDLMRVGVRLPSTIWHYEHLLDPRSTTRKSIMPPYPWLAENTLDVEDVQASLRAMKRLGVPYTDADIAGVGQQIQQQGGEIVADLAAANVDARADSEIVALIAYLKRMGVDGHNALAAQEGK